MVRKRLRELRVGSGLAQEDIAAWADMPQAAYSRIERGKTKPNLATAIKLARALGCDLDYLVEVLNDDNEG